MYLSLDTPLESPQVFSERQTNIEYQIDHFKNSFYILTNYEAENFCLMSCEEGNTTMDRWKMVIPTDSSILLEQFLHFDDCLVLAQRQNGLTQIRIISNVDGDSHLLEFPENAYMASIGMNPSHSLPFVRVQSQSISTPSTV